MTPQTKSPTLTVARAKWLILGITGITMGLAWQPAAARAFSTGITSASFGTTGCNTCQFGGAGPMAMLSGPTEVAPGSTNEYTLQIFATGSQQSGGLNVSTSGGTLSLGGSDSRQTQLLNGPAGRKEVTHLGRKAAANGMVTFTFLWAAPSPFSSVTLTAFGNAVNGDGTDFGDRAASPTLTISAASDPTATPQEPTATPTFTPVPTPPGGACTGDCSGDAMVTVDELVTGVNMALGVATIDTCSAFDTN